MSNCIIAMKSVTLAKKAERTLGSNGIRTEVVSIEPSLTKRGCGYGLNLSCRDTEKALELMRRKHITYGETLGSRR